MSEPIKGVPTFGAWLDCEDGIPVAYIRENKRGEYVHLSDYRALLAERDAAIAERDRLASALRDAASDLRDCAEFIRTLPKEMPGGYNTRSKAAETARHIEEDLLAAIVLGRSSGESKPEPGDSAQVAANSPAVAGDREDDEEIDYASLADYHEELQRRRDDALAASKPEAPSKPEHVMAGDGSDSADHWPLDKSQAQEPLDSVEREIAAQDAAERERLNGETGGAD